MNELAINSPNSPKKELSARLINICNLDICPNFEKRAIMKCLFCETNIINKKYNFYEFNSEENKIEHTKDNIIDPLNKQKKPATFDGCNRVTKEDILNLLPLPDRIGTRIKLGIERLEKKGELNHEEFQKRIYEFRMSKKKNTYKNKTNKRLTL